ncbi:ribosome small subunit-dependent GTPase A [Salibacterium halotolerans]|uniref:Small ribosomal subunit biogenesis GTPase RsgA n=1 Tax=Salibacterium halotolerans TaxID=1884432 RepID=A0A1I5M925_9BACI|nr:ribosome small subunit-dependent GTPase A [Salibacterium halotolerans]SFP06092.1 ribosome biogenesis GTPase [Salibacterium halotolerans]
MAEGLIVKAVSGFYYVYDQNEIYQCRARGLFRKKKIKPLVGDIVEYEAPNKEEGYLLQVMDRKNELTRPPAANIDQALIVFSARQPAFSTAMLDRFLVHMEALDIYPVIIVNKEDLADENLHRELVYYQETYQSAGYPFHLVSGVTETGVQKLDDYISGCVSMVTGESGVGKTTLLNLLIPSLQLETAEVSERLGRGKHTTKHLQLIPFKDGFIADTPGFSSLEFEQIDEEDLDVCFPEIRERLPSCKFRGCTHRKEPRCAVKPAVENGDIASFRYEHYVKFFEELAQRRRY